MTPTVTCDCGIKTPLPSARADQATGRPVKSWDVVCPCGAIVTTVNDFGNCNGLRKVKGFSGILAEQKRAITATRREIKLALSPLEAPILRQLNKLRWSDPSRRALSEQLADVRKNARLAWLRCNS